jgi:hypothetical protein
MLPAISLLTKISNHLELIRPDAKLQQQDERQVANTTASSAATLLVHCSILQWLATCPGTACISQDMSF